MIKRTSFVWKKPGVTDAAFKTMWLGEHAALAKRLKGLREYVVDFIDAPTGDLPSGIATVRFDSREALDAAFADATLRQKLLDTRDQFAGRVEVVIVDENVIVKKQCE